MTTRKTLVIEIDIESDDGEMAFECALDVTRELVDDCTIPNAIFEKLGDEIPVNAWMTGSRVHLNG